MQFVLIMSFISMNEKKKIHSRKRTGIILSAVSGFTNTGFWMPIMKTVPRTDCSSSEWERAPFKARKKKKTRTKICIHWKPKDKQISMFFFYSQFLCRAFHPNMNGDHINAHTKSTNPQSI